MEDIEHNIHKNKDESYFNCMGFNENTFDLENEQQLMQEIKRVASLIYLNGGHVNQEIRTCINELYDEKIQELRGTVSNMCVGTIIDSYKIAINKEIIKQVSIYAKKIFFKQ